jgi:hypothetical protein
MPHDSSGGDEPSGGTCQEHLEIEPFHSTNRIIDKIVPGFGLLFPRPAAYGDSRLSVTIGDHGQPALIVGPLDFRKQVLA